MVSGSFSLLCSRFFSPFLHSTGSWSPLIRPGFLVSWVTQVSCGLRFAFAYRAVTVSGYDFHRIRLALLLPLVRILLPRRCRDSAGLGSSAFARHYLRNHCYFLFLRVLRCFSSPRGPCGPGCPIRRFTGRGLFAPRRNFSQLITSFFASESLGILHAPLLTFFWPRATARAALGLIWVCFCSCFTLFPSCQGSFLWRITDSNR